MKSRPLASGQNILASQNNDKRDDSRGGGFLLAHQQLGALALATNPTNGQTVTVDINGTNVVATFVTAIGSTANNILIGASATASVTNLLNWLRRPDLTTSDQIAASGANQTLLTYVGWGWPGSSTTIVPFSLNKNVNGITGLLTSFNITTTVTSGSWTAQTMQLYIEDGAYYIGTTRVLYTGGSTPTFTAPVSNPRIDLITADSSGTIALVTGTESASPSAPSYPANKAVLAEVYHVVAETALYDNENQQAGQGYISNDVRPTLLIPYISSLTQVASGLFILDPGSEVQGNILYFNGSAWVLLAPGAAGKVLTAQGTGANPAWETLPTGNIAYGSQSGTDYSSSSSSPVAVDATNLKIVLTNLALGQQVLVSWSFLYKGSAGLSGCSFQVTDTTNSVTIGGYSGSVTTTYAGTAGTAIYIARSTSVTFELMYNTGGAGSVFVNNPTTGTPANIPSFSCTPL